MREVTKLQRYAAEDVFFGQAVINWARWFVIAAGLAIVLTNPEDAGDLVIGVAPLIGLIALNFYTHGRRLVEKPAGAGVVALTSVVDVGLITAAVVLGLGTGIGGGLNSPFYVAYMPVVLAFAFVMPRAVTAIFTVGTAVVYSVAVVLKGLPFQVEGATTNASIDIEALVTRLIVIIAVGGLGSFFWRIQRDRRNADRQSAAA